MSTQNDPENTNQPNPSEMDAVLGIINVLARKSSVRNYIYRGETKRNDAVSSSLYREYERIFPDQVRDLNIDRVQLMRLGTASLFALDNDELELLGQIQHYGGNTNLIDFTFDYLIALFFACDGEHSVPGRVVLLDLEGAMSDYISVPSQPANRVIAQKSIFVRHPAGIVVPDDEVEIPANLKLPLLDYLDNSHGISPVTIYNDVHGYIRYRAIHSQAFAKFNEGFIHNINGDYEDAIKLLKKAIDFNPRLAIAYVERGSAYRGKGDYDNAISDYSTAIRLHSGLTPAYHRRGLAYAKIGNYEGSIADFTAVVNLDPDFGPAYCDRGEARLHLSEWDNARADLATADDMGVDIVASFHNDYANVADFEQHTGRTVPADIAAMLGG